MGMNPQVKKLKGRMPDARTDGLIVEQFLRRTFAFYANSRFTYS